MMLFLKKTRFLQNTNQGGGNRTRLLILLAALSVLSLLLLLSLKLGSSSSNLYTYKDGDFSIKLPANYDLVEKATARDVFAPMDPNGMQIDGETITIGKYLANKGTDETLKKIETLHTNKPDGSVDQSIKVKRVNSDKSPGLMVTSKGSFRYFLAGKDYIWIIEFNAKDSESKLLAEAPDIAKTFKLADQ